MEEQVKLVSLVLRCETRWNRICLNYYWVSISNRIYRISNEVNYPCYLCMPLEPDWLAMDPDMQ